MSRFADCFLAKRVNATAQRNLLRPVPAVLGAMRGCVRLEHRCEGVQAHNDLGGRRKIHQGSMKCSNAWHSRRGELRSAISVTKGESIDVDHGMGDAHIMASEGRCRLVATRWAQGGTDAMIDMSAPCARAPERQTCRAARLLGRRAVP